MPCYVVTAPPELRGVYNTREEYEGQSRGMAVTHMKVQDREEAWKILSGWEVTLPRGLFAFTDANSRGGVGIVVVWVDAPGAECTPVAEVSTTMTNVFVGSGIEDLHSAEDVSLALQGSRTDLPEVAALFMALRLAPADASLVIVHDNLLVADYMTRAAKARGVMERVIRTCHELEKRKNLDLHFQHQYSHRADGAGRHDYVRYNKRAHELATEGAGGVV